MIFRLVDIHIDDAKVLLFGTTSDNQHITLQLADYKHEFLMASNDSLEQLVQLIQEQFCDEYTIICQDKILKPLQQHLITFKNVFRIQSTSLNKLNEIVELVKENKVQTFNLSIDPKTRLLSKIQKQSSQIFFFSDFVAQIEENYFILSVSQLNQLDDIDSLHLRQLLIDVNDDLSEVKVLFNDDYQQQSNQTPLETIDFVQQCIYEFDPDIIVGFDINVAFVTLFNSAQANNLSLSLSRLADKEVLLRESQYKGQTQRSIVIPGRVLLDLKRYIQLNFFTRANSPLEICQELNVDVPDEANILHIYQAILQQLQIVTTIEQLSCLSYTIPNHIIIHGQSRRVTNLIFNQSNQQKFMLPDKQELLGEERDIPYLEGGLVLEPQVGLYNQNKVIVFDFQSLYPSIIIAHNLCYSTILKQSDSVVHNDAVLTTSQNIQFDQLQRGILPQILDQLITMRTEVKAQLKSDKSCKYLESRQLALKLVANSVYGVSGMSSGVLFNSELAGSVTLIGREMLEQISLIVKQLFMAGSVVNGISLKQNAQIVYGDTDSIFVEFGDYTDEELKIFAESFTTIINNQFKKPICLKYEKTYDSFLIQGKKKYGGRIGDLVDVKGLEIIRKDQALYVQESLSSILKLLLNGGVDLAISLARQLHKKLNNGDVELNKLILSKMYTQDISQFKNVNLPHLAVVQKLKDRGIIINVGERINYLIILGTSSKQPLYQRSEDAKYAITQKFDVDFDYYLLNQFVKPVVRLFAPVFPNLDDKQLEFNLFG